MMTNATKTLIGVFIFALALLLLQLLLSQTGESEIFGGNLVNAQIDKVNKITLNHPADTAFVEIVKENGSWELHAENETYAADSQKVKMALRELRDMEVQSLLTRDPLKHSRYRVDSTGTTITLFHNEEILDRVITSSSQFPGSSGDMYVRLPGENQVFSVEGLSRSSIQSNFNYWRDLTVWILPPASMTEIRFTYPADSSFTMVKESGTWFSDGAELNQQKTTTLVNMLSVLQATGYPPEGIDSSLSDPFYTIEFDLDSGESKTIQFYEFLEAEPAPLYLATATDYPYTFTLAKRTWDQGVLLSRQDLLDE